MAGLLFFWLVLIIASFFADYDVIGEVYLDGSIDILDVAAWFLIWAEFSIFFIYFVDYMTAFVHFNFTASEVVFVDLFVDCGVVTVSFAFVSDLLHPHGFSFLHFHQLFLELFPLLVDFLHTLR